MDVKTALKELDFLIEYEKTKQVSTEEGVVYGFLILLSITIGVAIYLTNYLSGI